MSKYVIGVDFGSLSARAVLVSTADGKEIASAEYAYSHKVMNEHQICSPRALATTALQMPEDYLDALNMTVLEVLEKSRVSPRLIGALAIDFTASNILPILNDGTPLSSLDRFKHNPHAYCKMWKHHGATEEAKILTDTAKRICPEILEPYGGIISSEWCFSKIFETLRKAPEVYHTADRFIEAGDWITMMLTGSDKRSACFAGYKALWNRDNGYPPEEFFGAVDPELRNVVTEKMSGDVCELGEAAGELNEYGSLLTGLDVGTKVSVAVVDAHAALPSVGAVNPGDLMIIMGTSACHILISDKDVPINGICGRVMGGVVPGYIAFESGQPAVGDGLAWVINNCIGSEYEDEARIKNKSIYDLLNEKAEALGVGSGGLIALDWWNGNRSPYADYDLSGMILGITLSTPPEAIYRASVEAIAFGARRLVEGFENGGITVKRIIVSGGIAKKNPFIMQMLSDVLGREILISDLKEAPAMGSAVYAAVTAGAYTSIGDAARAMANMDFNVYTPRAEAKEKYVILYPEYVELSEYFHKTNRVMERLRKLGKGE
ncbi:MAG: ribulokinase [Clostridia bacterium]|nr:ribulokinase [Clostridia bacterium]